MSSSVKDGLPTVWLHRTMDPFGLSVQHPSWDLGTLCWDLTEIGDIENPHTETSGFEQHSTTLCLPGCSHLRRHQDLQPRSSHTRQHHYVEGFTLLEHPSTQFGSISYGIHPLATDSPSTHSESSVQHHPADQQSTSTLYKRLERASHTGN